MFEQYWGSAVSEDRVDLIGRGAMCFAGFSPVSECIGLVCTHARRRGAAPLNFSLDGTL